MKKKYPVQLKQFGEIIKVLRISNELTQVELAEKSGIDTRTIQRIEGGEFAATLHTLFALATVFNKSASELLNGVEVKRKRTVK
jgi:transcriptional regulator with XRE-family HTH domain